MIAQTDRKTIWLKFHREYNGYPVILRHPCRGCHKIFLKLYPDSALELGRRVGFCSQGCYYKYSLLNEEI